MCAGDEERDSCNGDSGSPLYVTPFQEGVPYQVALVSYGDECGNGVPAVYTRVEAYITWIRRNLRP